LNRILFFLIFDQDLAKNQKTVLFQLCLGGKCVEEKKNCDFFSQMSQILGLSGALYARHRRPSCVNHYFSWLDPNNVSIRRISSQIWSLQKISNFRMCFFDPFYWSFQFSPFFDFFPLKNSPLLRIIQLKYLYIQPTSIGTYYCLLISFLIKPFPTFFFFFYLK